MQGDDGRLAPSEQGIGCLEVGRPERALGPIAESRRPEKGRQGEQALDFVPVCGHGKRTG
jgi:hypothetical protein